VRTLAWESIGITWFLDCHTSDIGHWFAMTTGMEQTDKLEFTPRFQQLRILPHREQNRGDFVGERKLTNCYPADIIEE